MFGDTLVWTLLLASAVACVGAFALPQTRPYAKKYWWTAIVVIVPLAAYVLLRRRAGNSITTTIDEGRDIAEFNATAIDVLVDRASEQRAWADVELVRKRAETQAAVERMDAELKTIAKIDDSLARRRALIQVVEAYS